MKRLRRNSFLVLLAVGFAAHAEEVVPLPAKKGASTEAAPVSTSASKTNVRVTVETPGAAPVQKEVSAPSGAEVRPAETPVPAKVAATQAVKEMQKVQVELEWEEIPGAQVYDLEFQSLEGKVISTFRSKNHNFKFKMKVGKYKVRSRVADSRKVFGDWSDLNEFVVAPKAPTVTEKSVQTKGEIDPKTLNADVTYRWSEAPGASKFRISIMNAEGVVVKVEIVVGTSYKTALPAGEYTATLSSIGAEGVESEPVPLPGKVTIQSVQLPKPEYAVETVKDGTPVVKLKPNALADTVGLLEYNYFFGEEWTKVSELNYKNAKEIILDKAKKPGRYRLSLWSEAKGLRKSEVVQKEFVIKPKSYE